MGVVRSLAKTVVGVALGVLALPPAAMLVLTAVHRHHGVPAHLPAIGLGLLAAIALILFSRPNLLYHTMLHEACHAVACLVLGVRLRGFHATDGRGGKVEYEATGPLRSLLIAIAPYTLPLLLGPLLVARWWWRVGEPAEWLSGLVAFFYLLHIQGIAINLRHNFWAKDGDFAVPGRFLGLVLVLLAALLTTAATISVV